jgi:hypothetical protein
VWSRKPSAVRQHTSADAAPAYVSGCVWSRKPSVVSWCLVAARLGGDARHDGAEARRDGRGGGCQQEAGDAEEEAGDANAAKEGRGADAAEASERAVDARKEGWGGREGGSGAGSEEPRELPRYVLTHADAASADVCCSQPRELPRYVLSPASNGRQHAADARQYECIRSSGGRGRGEVEVQGGGVGGGGSGSQAACWLRY